MNNNQTMAAVIKFEVDENYKNESFYAREFFVPYNINIEELMESIKEFGVKYNVPIKRVYLSGHVLSLPTNLWDKDKIESYFQASLNTPNTVKESTSMKR